MSNPVVRIRGLSKSFPGRRSFWGRPVSDIVALRPTDLDIGRGETVGLVGESGCGKTTLGRCIVRGIEPSSGEIWVDDDAGGCTDFARLSGARLKHARRELQMIFQDPFSSLDPRMTVYDIIKEPIVIQDHPPADEVQRRVFEITEKVGLNKGHLRRYPHAFSGGQRQRIGIARALVVKPRVVVSDEAVSALDVSVQSQILNLMDDLKKDLDLSYLFISHDLSVVRYVADRIAVMYLGRIVESASNDKLFRSPRHPYTEALLSAIPDPDPRRVGRRIVLGGEVPNPARPPAGCPFHPRCRYAVERCRQEEPESVPIDDEHLVSCHRAGELQLRGVRCDESLPAST